MPLTLPTHPIAVIPLKLWRPRWFDGVALVLGAIAPDVVYVEDGYGLTVHSHTWHGLLWWVLPWTLVTARLVRWAAPTVAAHLPEGGPLALRDYGVLGTVRHRWYVTAVSAVVGAVSHIVWDAFTHPTLDGGRVAFPVLHNEFRPDWPWWYALSTASDLIGFVVGPILIVHIGSNRLLTRWHGPVAPTTVAPATFWSTVLAVCGAGFATLPFQPGPTMPAQAVRVMVIAGLGLLAGAAAVRVRTTMGYQAE